MLNPEAISETLEALSDPTTARKRRKHLKPFRGLRGVPVREVTSVLVDAWKASPVKLPDESDELHELFCTAFEDGMVAIGLLAAEVPSFPHEALDMVDRWLPMVDDTETADALGWLVLGPALIAAREDFGRALMWRRAELKPHARRTQIMAAMAGLPTPIEGAGAAALRERMGQRHLVMVDRPRSRDIRFVLESSIREQDPHVRKAITRVFRTWATFDPAAAEDCLNGISGGVPKQLRAEVERGIKKGYRKQAAAE